MERTPDSGSYPTGRVKGAPEPASKATLATPGSGMHGGSAPIWSCLGPDVAEHPPSTPPIPAGASATPGIWEGQRAQAKPSTLGVGSTMVKLMSVVALVIAPLLAL